MHVALSVDSLTPNLGGIGRYCWELINGTVHHPQISGVSYFRSSQWIDDPRALLEDVGIPPVHKKPWRSRLDRWWKHTRFDNRIIHAPNYFLPDWAEGGIATIHDLSVFKFPDTHPIERIEAFEKNFASTISRADLILTDCEWVRQEVISYTGLAPSKVRAIPLGISPEFRPRPVHEIKAALAAFDLPVGQYGLCVSTLEPRKRIGHLLEAWRALPPSLRDRHPLILAGGSGWCNDALMEQIAAGEQQGWVRYLGYVPEEYLPYLYAGARVFAYPSQYEGFGFPPLEAMACGIPTTIASGTCLEEVAGGGAMTANPEDIPAFMNILARMLEDDHQRIELSTSGVKVTSQYTWARCIEQTVQAYQTIGQDYF